MRQATGLDDEGWTTKDLEFRFRQGKRVFFFHSLHTSSGTYPASSPMDIGAYCQEAKQQGLEFNHSPSSDTEIDDSNMPSVSLMSS
jgi:hypothetical protein